MSKAGLSSHRHNMQQNAITRNISIKNISHQNQEYVGVTFEKSAFVTFWGCFQLSLYSVAALGCIGLILEGGLGLWSILLGIICLTFAGGHAFWFFQSHVRPAKLALTSQGVVIENYRLSKFIRWEDIRDIKHHKYKFSKLRDRHDLKLTLSGQEVIDYPADIFGLNARKLVEIIQFYYANLTERAKLSSLECVEQIQSVLDRKG
jgi:hypothetical protein